MKQKLVPAWLALLLLALAACAPLASTPPEPAAGQPVAAPTGVPAMTATPLPFPSDTPTPAATATQPSSPTPPSTATQEVPMTPQAGANAIEPGLETPIEQAKTDLSRRTGVAASGIEVVSAQTVTWPDAGLGCPQPGMAYAQVMVDGVRVVLRAGGQEYDYHGGGRRGLFLCEK